MFHYRLKCATEKVEISGICCTEIKESHGEMSRSATKIDWVHSFQIFPQRLKRTTETNEISSHISAF